MNRFSLREHAPSILVAALSSAFGVALLQVTGGLAAVISASDRTGSSGTVALVLTLLAIVFIVIATYVGAVVTANTFATIIAGRTRSIALLRLIGATARSQRVAVAREGLIVGIIGTIAGALAGTLVGFVLFSAAEFIGLVPTVQFSYFEPVLLVPIAGVVLTTWLASWLGSRRVLVVSPVQATGAAQEPTLDEAAGNRKRNTVSLVLFVAGSGLLGVGILVGLVDPIGVLVGLVGGLLSFTGLVLGAEFTMSPALRMVGKLLGASAPARLAAQNALRYPRRSARTTIGLVIGVTLVTMFAVAVESYQVIIHAAQAAEPEAYLGTDEVLVITVSVFSVLMGFSALIASVGLVTNLSLSVLQRTRELGLLRALGFTRSQVRTMIVAESAQLSVAAVLVGLVLGTAYGWAGAQSLLGSITGSPGLIVPAVPVLLLVVVAVAAAVLTVAASVAPARRATSVVPVAALAVE